MDTPTATLPSAPPSSSARPSPSAQEENRRPYCVFAAAAAILIGVLVLIGWAFDITALKSISPNLVSMKPNAALGFALTGIALRLLVKEPSTEPGKRVTRRIAQILAFVVMLMGALTFLEYVFGWDFRIDQLLFRELPGAILTSSPGRIAFLGAINFVFLGTSLLLLSRNTPQRRAPEQYPALLAVFITWFVLIGYSYGILSTHFIPSSTEMPILSMVAFALLSTGILYAGPDRGLMHTFVADSPGGAMLRRLLPGSAVILLLLSWLRLMGETSGSFSTMTGRALNVLSSTILLAFLLYLTAKSLNRSDAERRLTEERFRSLVESSGDAIIITTVEGMIVGWNPGAENVYGYSAEEVIGRPISFLLAPERSREMEGILKGIERGEFVKPFRTARQRKDGKEIHVSLSLSPVKDPTGRIIGAASIARDITAREEADALLRRASAYNRSLIEASLDPLVTISPGGKITDVNSATELATGRSRQALIGTDFSEYFTEPEKARAGYQEVFREGRVQDYPLEIRRRDGRITPVLYNASVYLDIDGKIVGAFAAARDITARKQAELDLKKASAYNRSLIESSVDPLVTIAPDGKITDVNSATELATGRSRQALIGTDFSDYFTEPEKARAGYQQVFREGRVRDYELEIRRLDGRITPVLYNASVYRDIDGNIVGVFAAARDITERKRAEQALQKASTHNRSLLEASLDPLVTISPDGKITDVNNATELATGCTRDVLIGADFSDYFTEPEKARAGYQQVFREGRVQDYPLEIRRRDGYVTPVLYNASVYRDANDEIVGVFAAARDVTERRRAEEQFLKLHAELEERVAARTAELAEKNKELESFTYAVAHDLRAPLRRIEGFSSLLVADFGSETSETAGMYLKHIREGVSRMARLLEDLLNLSRTGRQSLRLQQCRLNPLVEEVLAELAPDLKDRRIEWRIGQLPSAECDPALIKQVFTNLISNAIKFTRSRDKAIIEIDQTPVDGQSAIYVRDNGVGFSMKYADKLFRIFQRLHRQEDFEGTGIGLATVQQIIHKHGGQVWVDAELDKGAAFYFTLGGK